MKSILSFLPFVYVQDKLREQSFKTVLLILFATTSIFSQEIVKDSTKTQKLEEILVNAIRVKEGSPMTYSNVSKEDSTHIMEGVFLLLL